jgi:hypothetical protein
LRYHGVFAPHAKARERVVPPPEPVAPAAVAAARKLGKPERPAPARKAARTYRIPWADLLAKVFEVFDFDVLACPECGGRMMLIAFIAEPTIAKHILDHLHLDSTGPPLAPARGDGADSVDRAPAYDVADPVYES